MKAIKWFAILSILIFLSSQHHLVINAQDDHSCVDYVAEALATADQYCEHLERHQACYGNVNVEVEPRDSNHLIDFESPGDIVGITTLQSLHLSELDIEHNQWGVVKMQLQADIPTAQPEGVTLILFGNVSIDNAVQTTTTIEVQIANEAGSEIFADPWLLSIVIGSLDVDENAAAIGRTEDHQWIKITLTDGSMGWVKTSELEPNDDLENLEVIDHQAEQQTPMQAFYFESVDSPSCTEIPTSGMLIQTPEGVAEVNFLINEVSIQLGSTAFIQAAPNSNMQVTLLEGHAQIKADNTAYDIIPGVSVSIPLDADLSPTGPPNNPVPYNAETINELPLKMLDRNFVIVDPPDQTEIPSRSNSDSRNNNGNNAGGRETSNGHNGQGNNNGTDNRNENPNADRGNSADNIDSNNGNGNGNNGNDGDNGRGNNNADTGNNNGNNQDDTTDTGNGNNGNGRGNNNDRPNNNNIDTLSSTDRTQN